MGKPKSKRKRDRDMMAVRVPDELREALRDESNRRGLTLTDLVVTVLSKWVTAYGGEASEDPMLPLPKHTLNVAAHPRMIATHVPPDVRAGSDGPAETKGKEE